MDIARYSIERPTSSWIILLVLLVGGLTSLSQLGRLEDPEFTIKQAMVITPYPGASATQVEEEVTVKLENAIQQLPYVRHITSTSMPGLSQITVEMRDIYRAQELAQIWDELRRKMHDIEPNMPPGSGPIQINDDFADVYGVMLALHGEGYTLPALHDHAKYLRRELSLIPGVGKVIIDGVQQEQVSVEISRARLANLGIPPNQIYELLRTQNTVSNAGRVKLEDEAVRFYTTGEFDDVEALESLIISNPGSDAQLYLGDVADITRELAPIPNHLVRINGQKALWLGISFTSDVNVVEVGAKVQKRIDSLLSATPVGMEITPIYNQPKAVDASVSGFLWSLVQAVAIVVFALFVTMGKRSGFLIGLVLFLTVTGTFIFMNMFGIQLHRVSLGALIIALGMLVDNAIVITEGILVGVQRGKSRLAAAQEVLKQNQWPLLGATLIAIIAFAPIGLSQDATGEFAGSLFWVLLISLGLSWLTALILIPFLANKLFARGVAVENSDEAIYNRPVFRVYQKILSVALAKRGLTMFVMTALLVGSVYGFGQVKQSFFPRSNTPIFFASLWYPQGTDIRATSENMARIENHLLAQPEVVSVASTIGRGAPRFTLPYLVEKSHENYGQLIIEVHNKSELPRVIADTRDYIAAQHPEVRARLSQMEIGPPVKAALEVRFSGADPNVLRQLAQQAEQRLALDPGIATLWHNWFEPSKVLRPQFNETHARRVGITRENVDDLLLANFEGRRVGVYRDGTDLLPIIVRAPADERLYIEQWQDILVHSPSLNRYIPLPQVVDDIALEWEESIIQRRDRKRTLTVMADPDPLSEETPAVILDRIRADIESIEMPSGYTLEWGGEYEASTRAKSALFSSLPLGYLAMFIITVLLFSSARKALVIWTTVPLSIIGVTLGLLVTQQAFSFMALLGMLSLTGMLIKNGIVLLEQVKAEEDAGKSGHTALIDASVKRVRPVSMAAVTTILGMIPLLFDAFFAAMAVTIMFGLGFATILTLIVVPVMYSVLLPYKAQGETQTNVD